MICCIPFELFSGLIPQIIATSVTAIILIWGYRTQIQSFQTQIEAQKKDAEINRIDNKFYELLKLHKENLNEIKIRGYNGNIIEGRKAFVQMFNEFRYCYGVCKLFYDGYRDFHKDEEAYPPEKLLGLAYIFLYAGVGNNSDLVSDYMIAGGNYDENLITEIRTMLKEIQKDKSRANLITISEGKFDLDIDYPAFQGHMSRFGHYYRHLFQTVSYVVGQKPELVPEIKKDEYLRTLRAQLSNHEQLMLYYNAVSGFGRKWISRKYFVEWKMIHNLPLPLANFGVLPYDLFKEYMDTKEEVLKYREKYVFEDDEPNE